MEPMAVNVALSVLVLVYVLAATVLVLLKYNDLFAFVSNRL